MRNLPFSIRTEDPAVQVDAPSPSAGLSPTIKGPSFSMGAATRRAPEQRRTFEASKKSIRPAVLGSAALDTIAGKFAATLAFKKDRRFIDLLSTLLQAANFVKSEILRPGPQHVILRRTGCLVLCRVAESDCRESERLRVRPRRGGGGRVRSESGVSSADDCRRARPLRPPFITRG